MYFYQLDKAWPRMFYEQTNRHSIHFGLLRRPQFFFFFFLDGHNDTQVTPHTGLRDRDHYNSSTLIGGKGGASPSSSSWYA